MRNTRKRAVKFRNRLHFGQVSEILENRCMLTAQPVSVLLQPNDLLSDNGPAAAASAVTPPAATTVAATSITATGATLNASVNPEGSATTYSFVYGTNATLSSGTTTTTKQTTGNETSAESETAALAGLTPSTTYYFKVQATNAGGTTDGAILHFTTLGGGGGGTSVSITVSGTAKWTDPGGGTHAIPLAYVEIRSSTEADTDPPLATCQTDVNGNFSATLNFDASSGAMVFARIYARNPAADVKPNTGAGATTYYMDSQQVAVTAAGSITLPERDASNSVVSEESFDILGGAPGEHLHGASRRWRVRTPSARCTISHSEHGNHEL